MSEECWNFNTVEPPLPRPVYGPGGQFILLFKPVYITAIPLYRSATRASPRLR